MVVFAVIKLFPERRFIFLEYDVFVALTAFFYDVNSFLYTPDLYLKDA